MTELANIRDTSGFDRPEHPNCIMARIAEVEHSPDWTALRFENGYSLTIDRGWKEDARPGDVAVICRTYVFLWRACNVPFSVLESFREDVRS